ncbi:potassium transporter TrkA, partial [Streptomyces asiaticus]
WRVIALDAAEPADRQRDLAAAPRDDGAARQPALVWEPRPGYLLQPQDRVVLAVTRQGLGVLLSGDSPTGVYGSQGADR